MRPIAILGACLLLMTAHGALAAPPQLDRDAQWIFRARTGDGEVAPSAIFLSWNYTSVLFRATCEAASHTVRLTYFADPSEGDIRKYWDRRPLTVVFGQTRIGFTTTAEVTDLSRPPYSLTGKLKVTPRVLKAFKLKVPEVSIVAPEEESGEWFVGDAEPLRRLVRLCA